MEIESIPCASGSFDNISIHSLFIMEATEQKNRLKKNQKRINLQLLNLKPLRQ